MCATVCVSFGSALPSIRSFSVALGDADRARAARRWQRRLEHARAEVDPVRRQLSDAVRDDRPREVDRLTASAAEWKVGDASQGSSMSNT
jgi:hypothetical protein